MAVRVIEDSRFVWRCSGEPSHVSSGKYDSYSSAGCEFCGAPMRLVPPDDEPTKPETRNLHEGESMQPREWSTHIMKEIERYLLRLECPDKKDVRAFNGTIERFRGDVRHALAGFATRMEELPAEPPPKDPT